MSQETQSEELKELEFALLEARVRSSRDLLEDLLHDAFREFGQSGRIYTKQEIIWDIPLSPIDAIDVEDIQVKRLGQRHALVTYHVRSRLAGSATLSAAQRSSIWRSDSATWRLLFHQGTPIENADNWES